MSTKRYKSEQVVNPPQQIEVEISKARRYTKPEGTPDEHTCKNLHYRRKFRP